MTRTPIEKAKALSIDEFRDLAKQYPGVRVDVAFRVNPSGYEVWGGEGKKRDFWERKPSAAVYYVAPNSGHSPAERKFREDHGSVVYLAPVVGKLLRDAGYIGYGTRARSLGRTLADMEAEAKKHLPEQLDAMDQEEAARIQVLATIDARKQIREAASCLAKRIERLGLTAGFDMTREIGAEQWVLDTWDNAARLVEVLDDAIPKDAKR